MILTDPVGHQKGQYDTTQRVKHTLTDINQRIKAKECENKFVFRTIFHDQKLKILEKHTKYTV